jgi:hypothetical protein
VKGDAQALAEFEVVRYKAIVKEKFQARIPKNRISTTTRDTSGKCDASAKLGLCTRFLDLSG